MFGSAFHCRTLIRPCPVFRGRISITTEEELTLANEASQAGADFRLTKPYGGETLLGLLQEILAPTPRPFIESAEP